VQYRSALSQLDVVMQSLEVDCLSGSDASAALKDSMPTLRRLAALAEQLADRCEATNVPAAEGFSSAVEWRASVMGTSSRSARKKRKTRRDLEKKSPAASNALNNGEISQEQADALAGAVDPDGLFDEEDIATLSPEEIEELARRQALLNAKNDAEIAARRHRLRGMKRWTDVDGNRKTLLTLIPEMDAEFHAKLQPFFKKRLAGSSKDTFAQKSADAFMDLIRSSGGKITRVVNAHISLDALRRGWIEGEERSEIAGIGSVPVSVIRQWMDDCILRLLITEKNKLVWATNLKEIPTRIKEFIKAAGWHRCANCGKARDLEVDHTLAKSNRGTDEVVNLQPLCEACHDMKTRTDSPWTAGKNYGRKFFDTG
jgi:hypothetical protein